MSTVVRMSTKELDRARVVARVIDRRLSQRDAARQLGVTARTVRRLCRVYEAHGPAGLVSQSRGRRSNRQTPDELRRSAAALLTAHYADFGPTLATEKLVEVHGFEVSVPTVRKWMTELGLWKPRNRRLAIHQPRHRRACRGELIQSDGSDHNWFEDRAPRAVLLVFVDEATSELMEVRFVEGETTFGYFECVQRYLQQHGRPVAFYSDKASIFRVNLKDHGGTGLTQFGRAMQDLNIDVLCANSAPAKGRVERANRTLQDRLVKELRLQGISDIVAANDFLDAHFRYEDDAGRVTIRTKPVASSAPRLSTGYPRPGFSQEMWSTTSCSAAHWRWLDNSKSTPRTSGSSTLGPSGSGGWRQRAWRRPRLDDDPCAGREREDVALWNPVQRTFLSYGEEDISTLREQCCRSARMKPLPTFAGWHRGSIGRQFHR
jgi:transposase